MHDPLFHFPMSVASPVSGFAMKMMGIRMFTHRLGSIGS